MPLVWIWLLPAGSALLRAAQPPGERAVAIYLENIPQLPWDLERTKAITSHIFLAIHVKVAWIDFHLQRTAPQDGTIVVNFRMGTPIVFQPHALARSYPYEGTHVEVFYDRVQQLATANRISVLLAYVLAHEIAHVLEGTVAHSRTGIMKAGWDVGDFDQMAQGNLAFTDPDIHLIYAGLDARATRMTADLRKHH